MKRIFLTIYVLISITVLLMIFGVGPILNRLMVGIELEEERSEFRGVFALITQDLESMPESTWKAYIEGLNELFDYPITVALSDSILPPDGFQEDYDQGMLIPTTANVEGLVQKISGTSYSLTMGPLPEVKYINIIEFFMALLTFVVLAIPVFVWSFFLWGDISSMEAAARIFGGGELGARVDVSRFSSLMGLKSTFNAMADRIQKLIASHKELTNAVSHELRTPLSRIHFGMEMVKTGNSREKQAHYFQGIERDVGEIEALVDEMLTYARFDRDAGEVTLVTHEIVSWLRYIMACEAEGAGGIGLELDVEATVLEANFDPQYMAWAVRNLIRNALRYAEKEVRISVECPDNCVSVFIDDDGPGILPEHRVRIFEPFARIDESRNRKSGGYGLGLAIVRRIAIAHNGSVCIGDAPGGGARFVLSWPRTSIDPSGL